jgi:hypothetical protein
MTTSGTDEWVDMTAAIKWYVDRYKCSHHTARHAIWKHCQFETKGFPFRKTKVKGKKLPTRSFNLKQLAAFFDAEKKKRKVGKSPLLKPLFKVPDQVTVFEPDGSPSVQPGMSDNIEVVLDPNELKYIETLADPSAGPVEKGRATYNLCTLRFSRMAREGAVSGSMLKEISRALQELRRSEDGYMDIEKQRGNLVPLELCQEVVGELVRRLNDICSKLNALLCTEIEVWLSASMNSTERRKAIRAWLQKQMHELRSLEGKGAEEATKEILAHVERRHEELKGKMTQ